LPANNDDLLLEVAGTNRGVFININKSDSQANVVQHTDEILHKDELCSDEESEHSNILIKDIINQQ